MNTNNNSNRLYIGNRLWALVLVIKCCFDLYHNVKRFGFNDNVIVDIAIIICLVILYTTDLVYDKKRRDMSKVIIIITLVIPISAYIVNLYLDVKRFGFNYGSIVYVAIIIYLVIWYIMILAYDKKGRDMPNVIKVILLVILLSVVIVTLILSTIDRYRALTVY